MDQSLKAAIDYETRALAEIKEAREALQQDHLESAVSTAYYSCFYAIHAKLAALGVLAKSHKQTGIEFRRHFVKTKRMDKKYSRIFKDLFEWRLIADYTALPPINQEKAKELVGLAEALVTTLLKIK